MPKMKQTKKYCFTVEGETEQWYLKRNEFRLYLRGMDCGLFRRR